MKKLTLFALLINSFVSYSQNRFIEVEVKDTIHQGKLTLLFEN
jgi:hypothetical protein